MGRSMSSSSGPLAAPSPSDADLVIDVLGGGNARFEGLMRRHNQRVFRVVRSFAASDADAEDQAQEVWLLAYRHLAQWDGRAGFGAWITKIAVRHALRSRGTARTLAVLDDEMLGDTRVPAPETAAGTEELRRLIERAITSLPDTLRVVFVLRELEDLDGPETAEALGLTPEAVRVRLHRARQAMRTWFEDAIAEGARGAFEFAGERCDRIVAAVLARLDQP
jgi:RNA polymerase sigma-70 factor, ECF subfamily